MGAEIFRDTRAILVESIFWDARTEEVVWADITAGTLHRGPIDGAVDGSDDRVVELPPPVSAVQPAAGGGYVAALKDRVVLLDADGRIERDLAQVAHAHSGIRFNEGKVDPFGAFVVGSMDLTRGDPDAALYRISPDGRVVLVRGGFGTANGFEWSDVGDEMLLTDTASRTVYRASYDADGTLGALDPFLVGRMSDGLVRDIDGTLWNGIYGDGAVVHWSSGGDVLGELRVSAPNVTSVAFAGTDLDVLLVGTARENLTEDALERHPLSGGIFRFDGVGRGRPVPVFDSDHTPDRKD